MIPAFRSAANTCSRYCGEILLRSAIAASANYNYFISKKVENERTATKVKLLNEKEVLCEIARISSGEVNEVTLQYANELRKKVS